MAGRRLLYYPMCIFVTFSASLILAIVVEKLATIIYIGVSKVVERYI